MTIQIDPARPPDAGPIDRLLRDAFPGAAEAHLVASLRARGHVRLELVARRHGRIAGHILFSGLAADGAASALDLDCLAPVAVSARDRRHGIAARLIVAGLYRLEALGTDAVFVLGDPDYYGRFGFEHEPAKAYAAPWSDHPAHQVLALGPRFASNRGGRLRYPGPFFRT